MVWPAGASLAEHVRLSGLAEHLVHLVLVRDLGGDQRAGVLLEAHVLIARQLEERLVRLQGRLLVGRAARLGQAGARL